jgi:hypothetical protein
MATQLTIFRTQYGRPDIMLYSDRGEPCIYGSRLLDVLKTIAVRDEFEDVPDRIVETDILSIGKRVYQALDYDFSLIPLREIAPILLGVYKDAPDYRYEVILKAGRYGADTVRKHLEMTIEHGGLTRHVTLTQNGDLVFCDSATQKLLQKPVLFITRNENSKILAEALRVAHQHLKKNHDALKKTIEPWADCPLCHSSDIHILHNQTYTDNLVLQCDGCNTRFEMDTPDIAEARERWNERDTPKTFMMSGSHRPKHPIKDDDEFWERLIKNTDFEKGEYHEE